MDNPLHLALWNANGLTQHAEELRTFISYHSIDVMLISETHFTDKNYFKLPFYSVYHTNQPAGTAHDGSAIIIKNSIQHNLHNGYSSDPTSYNGFSGRLHWSTNHFCCPFPSQPDSYTGAPWHLQLPWEALHSRWWLQRQTHSLGIQTPSPTPALHGRTHLLALRH
jgi:hypothetical protein